MLKESKRYLAKVPTRWLFVGECWKSASLPSSTQFSFVGAGMTYSADTPLVLLSNLVAYSFASVTRSKLWVRRSAEAMRLHGIFHDTSSAPHCSSEWSTRPLSPLNIYRVVGLLIDSGDTYPVAG